MTAIAMGRDGELESGIAALVCAWSAGTLQTTNAVMIAFFNLTIFGFIGGPRNL